MQLPCVLPSPRDIRRQYGDKDASVNTGIFQLIENRTKSTQRSQSFRGAYIHGMLAFEDADLGCYATGPTYRLKIGSEHRPSSEALKNDDTGRPLKSRALNEEQFLGRKSSVPPETRHAVHEARGFFFSEIEQEDWRNDMKVQALHCEAVRMLSLFPCCDCNTPHASQNGLPITQSSFLSASEQRKRLPESRERWRDHMTSSSTTRTRVFVE